MKERTTGSQNIGTGLLKWLSFLQPYWYQDQNFIVTFASKLYAIIFFTTTFTAIITMKNMDVVSNMVEFGNETARARTIAAIMIVMISLIDSFSIVILNTGFL